MEFTLCVLRTELRARSVQLAAGLYPSGRSCGPVGRWRQRTGEAALSGLDTAFLSMETPINSGSLVDHLPRAGRRRTAPPPPRGARLCGRKEVEDASTSSGSTAAAWSPTRSASTTVLGRRCGPRPRVPHPEIAAPRPGRPAVRRAGRPSDVPALGPVPAPVGVVRHQRAGGWPGGTPHQDPPRHDRWGVGRRADPACCSTPTRRAREVEGPTSWGTRRGPPRPQMFRRALLDVRRPQKVCQIQARIMRPGVSSQGTRPCARWCRCWLDPSSDRQTMTDPCPRPHPPTPFNRTITAHRRFAYRSLRLTDAQTVKRAFGVTSTTW